MKAEKPRIMPWQREPRKGKLQRADSRNDLDLSNGKCTPQGIEQRVVAGVTRDHDHHIILCKSFPNKGKYARDVRTYGAFTRPTVRIVRKRTPSPDKDTRIFDDFLCFWQQIGRISGAYPNDNNFMRHCSSLHP